MGIWVIENDFSIKKDGYTKISVRLLSLLENNFIELSVCFLPLAPETKQTPIYLI